MRACVNGLTPRANSLRKLVTSYTARLTPLTSLRVWLRILAARSARGLHLLLALFEIEGAGKTGCLLHPRSRVRFAQTKLHTSIQGSGNTPAFPAQGSVWGCYRVDFTRHFIGVFTFVSRFPLVSQRRKIFSSIEPCGAFGALWPDGPSPLRGKLCMLRSNWRIFRWTLDAAAVQSSSRFQKNHPR
jgi:hypothetical protein